MDNPNKPHDKYLKLRDLSAYAGISIRKLRDLIKDSDHPLPSFRLDGVILVRRSEFDAWLEQFRLREKELNRIVDEVVNEFH